MPAAILTFSGVVCFILVAAGAINYSEEDTAMIIGGLLIGAGMLFLLPGVFLLIAGIVQGDPKSKQTQSSG